MQATLVLKTCCVFCNRLMCITIHLLSMVSLGYIASNGGEMITASPSNKRRLYPGEPSILGYIARIHGGEIS